LPEGELIASSEQAGSIAAIIGPYYAVAARAAPRAGVRPGDSMSDPDNPSRRRPPTIDLTAQEVETEQAPPSGGGAPGAARPSARWSFFAGAPASQAIAAGAGAVIAAAIIAILWSAGIIPSRDSVAPPQSVQATPEISTQLNKIQSELQTRAPVSAPDPALTSRLAALEAQSKTLTDSLAALNRRLDDVAVAAKSAGEHADAASAAAKSAGEHADAASAAAKQSAQTSRSVAQSAVQRSDLDALSGRIAALDQKITALGNATAQQPTSTADRTARAALAAQALRAAVDRGAPYAAELAAVKSLGAAAADVAPLEPFAASGVPSAADLGRELAQLTPSLQKHVAGAPPSNASFLARLEDNAKNLVHVTPVDAPPPGDDPTSVIARLDIAAAHADIAAALADIARLPQPLQTLAAPWVQKAKARTAAIAAAQHIAADAFADLGKSDNQ
jgi:hypothetical protein